MENKASPKNEISGSENKRATPRLVPLGYRIGKRKNYFSRSQVQYLKEQLARRDAEIAHLSIEMQRLLKQTEQRATELQIINNIGHTLTEGLDLQNTLERVGDRLRDVLKPERFLITVFDEKIEHIYAHYGYWNGRRDSGETLSLRQIRASMRLSARGGGRSWIVNRDAEKSFRIFGGVNEDEIPKSFAKLPLHAGGKVVGGITLADYTREDAYTDISIGMLETIASNIGTAIQNARLFEETQRLLKETEQRATELQIINNIGQTLTEGLDLSSTLERVGERLREALQLKSVGIIANDSQTGLAITYYLYHYGKKVFPEDFSAHKNRLAMRFAMKMGGKPLVVNTNAEKYWRKIVGDMLVWPEIPKSFVIVPLLAGRQLVGSITIGDYEEENAFLNLPINLLETIAANMGTAIQNVRLFDETQRLLKETEQRATELQIINNIGQTLTEGGDLENMIKRVGERIQEALNVNNIAISIFDKETNHVIAPYMVRDGKEVKLTEENFDLRRYKLMIRASARAGGTSWVVNKDAEKSWRKSWLGTIGQDVPKSFVALPLLAVGEVIGGISLADYENENAFTDLSVNLLETIASNMGTAVQNVRLFDETQRLLKQTEQRAAELQIINNIGQTITGELDLNTMIDKVGDKLREAFQVGDIRIAVVDEKTGSMISPYVYRYGKRVAFEENWQEKAARYKLAMRASARTGLKTWVGNTNAEKSWRKFATVVENEDVPKSFVMLPLLVGKEVIGGITIPDYEKENAFTDFSVSMLETIASNMATAIQNVRLFEETKRLFTEAKEARASAEHANKAKSTFLANMSHELRTPLNAIMGFTRIVRRKSDGVLPEKQIENLDKVLSSSEHLLGLINTVLDIAKIEAGRMDVIPARFNLSVLIEQCANLAMPLLKPNVTLVQQLDDSIGIIFSDQDKIKQIVINLLSNAAKFTHEGNILLCVEKLSEHLLSIAVTDSGIGISPEALGRIFDEFQQADDTTTRQYGGTGLGLTISRSLARLLGGDLTATSEPGRGSTFTLTIPIHYGRSLAHSSDPEMTSVQEAATQPERATPKRRILVVDDDPDALYLLQEGLGTNDFEILGARNALDGLQLARDQHPDAILLDVLMPEIDGWQILNDLKTDPATTNTPVILLTIVDKKALGFKLGAADYLLKPLDPSAVLAALQRVVGEQTHQPKHVLVVDDDPNIVEMLRQTLPESDFRVESAEDGETGLQILRMHRPDVILLDLMMPRLDGFGVIERLRADPEMQKIPVIVIGAKDLTDEESKSLRESVVSVMKKQDFKGDMLRDEINGVVKK